MPIMSRHRSASVVPQQMFFVRSVTLGDWHSFFFSFSLTPSLKRLIILGYIYIYTIIINIFFSHFFFCVWNGMAQNEKQRREEKKNENTCTPRQNNKKKYKNKIILEFKRSLSLSLSLQTLFFRQPKVYWPLLWYGAERWKKELMKKVF